METKLSRKGGWKMKKQAIVITVMAVFLVTAFGYNFAYGESVIIGPKIGITYPINSEASSRYSCPWQNFGAFVRVDVEAVSIQGEFEYLRSKTLLEFSSFLGKTSWSSGGEVDYLATPFWLSLITKISFLRAGIGFGIYSAREKFEGGVAEDEWAYYYVGNHSISDTFYGIQYIVGLSNTHLAMEAKYSIVPTGNKWGDIKNLGGVTVSLSAFF